MEFLVVVFIKLSFVWRKARVLNNFSYDSMIHLSPT